MAGVDFDAARRSLSAFADLAGRPLTEQQTDSLMLEARVTVIVAPRQSGKSESLGVLGLHHAFAHSRSRVLIVSAGEEAARRLLARVREIATSSPLLRGSVVDETAGLLTLTNGSELRSVPASERQVRGWSVDLLLVDEAAMVSDDLILGAAFPTTAARPQARIVMASSATTAAGAFYDHVMLGRQGAEHVRAFAWRLSDAPWISASVIAAARESMTPTRFSAEYEGQFASGADALYPRELLDRATADFLMPGMAGLGEHAGLAGVDWGVTNDRTALVVVSRLAVPAGLFAVTVANAWPSGFPLDGPGGIVGEIAELPAVFEQVSAEVNGVGYPLAQSLERRLRDRRPRPVVEFIHTSGALKAATYGALRMLLEQGKLVLPASAEGLLREMMLLRVELTQQGGERIEAGVGHDDLADSLMLSLGPYQDSGGQWRSRLGDAAEREGAPSPGPLRGETVTTGAGVVLPRRPVLAHVGGIGGSVSFESYMDDRPPAVIRKAGLTLTGNHHVDKPPRGLVDETHAVLERRGSSDPYNDAGRGQR
jgi:hypothetical protein